MSFLDKLGNKLGDFYNSAIESSFGQTDKESLSSVEDGRQIPFGALGDFAKKIDKSATRSYTEDGFLRTDLFNSTSKQLEILMQEPNATILVKKKMFSSLANNYRPDYMSNDEKLFYKACKILFKNKCGEISALEQLSKINRVLDLDASYTEQMLPAILGAVDSLTAFNSNPISGVFESNKVNGLDKLIKISDQVRSILSFRNPARTTTWIRDLNDEDTGVIELTNVTNFSTGCSVRIGEGNANFSISDPYNKMIITEYDIEKAIADATDSFYNKSFFKFSLKQVDNLLSSFVSRFNELRRVRGASGISFKINANTVLSKRVVAVVDRIGTEVLFEYSPGIKGTTKVDNECLLGGSLLGNDGLDPQSKSNIVQNIFADKVKGESELSLFNEIINTIFSKLTLTNNSHTTFQLRNEKTNYARRKMRAFLLGRNILQPMDEINIFVSSKAGYDNKVLAGLKSNLTGLNVIQKFGATVYDLKNQFSAVFNPSNNLDIQSEKIMYVGREFPDRLWVYLRNLFVSEKEGVCIFSGLITNAGTQNSGGSYKVTVNCSDKTGYLEMGNVNFNPGADNFNGAIFDQLTPFKTRFDSTTTNFGSGVPELLDENKAILGDGVSNQGLLKFKSGPGIGQFVTESNFVGDVTINPTTGQKERYIHGPDGLVYNWKQGIGIYVAYGNSLEINDPNKVGVQSLFKNPFAGQDVMNVISLLVTGRPYNFINYWRNVVNLDGLQNDPILNKSGANSYFQNLKNELQKNNVLWGNFIPFKTLSINDESYAKVLNAEFSVNRKIEELNNKLSEFQELDTKNYLLSARKDIETSQAGIAPTQGSILVKEKMDQLQIDIQKLQNEIVEQDKTLGLSITGNDVTFSADGFINDEDESESLSEQSSRRNLRRRINELTKRVSWKVRANQDKNLFIVDDSYDKDFDFAAYEKSLAGDLSLYNNDFGNVKSHIENVTNLLNLEFYADSQGNLRVRAPQFNKIPSSVFYRLINLKKQYGIKIYPEFLDNLFKDQIDGLKLKIEIIEDEIRLFCSLLDITDDLSILIFMSSNSNLGSGGPFGLITNEDGTLERYDVLIKSSDPDIFENDETLSVVRSNATSNKSYFSPKERSEFVLSLLTPENRAKYTNASSIVGSTRTQSIIERLKIKTGKPVKITDFYFDLEFASQQFAPRKELDLVAITNELAKKISERQKAIKLFYESLKNSIELKSIENTSTSNGLLTPQVSFNSVPEILDHMIEDESYDDLGPGSGSRYIIKNSQIKSINYTEQPPDYTSVQVNGSFNEFEQINGGQDLTSAITNNNGLSSAFAIDYDLVRTYGLKSTSPVNIPFLTDPKTQLAPYASTLLAKARKNILRANVTIVGNEYQQPGEVVYIEDNQMLYYVKSVNHEFSFNGSFTTSLNLEYGHAPGDYIPNVFDTVGKVIYNNRDVIDFINYRQSNNLNETSLGTIILDENSFAAFKINDDKNQNISKYSKNNAKVIQDILNTIAYQFDINNIKDNPIQATLELRIYFDDKNVIPTNLKNLREDIKQVLTGQKETFNTSETGKLQITIPKEFIKAENDADVNLSNEDDPRSPSQQAINIARDLYEQSGALKDDRDVEDVFSSTFGENSTPPSFKQNGIKKNLFKYVIDCYLKFETKEIL